MGVMLGEPTEKCWSYVKRLKKLPNRCWIDTNLLTSSLASLPANVCKRVKATTVPAAGFLTASFISRTHTNFTSILMAAQSKEEFVKQLEAVPKHACYVHEWVRLLQSITSIPNTYVVLQS